MDKQREALWRSTDLAHSSIQHAGFDIKNIALQIEYLHPKLADELDMIADRIEQARGTIQGNSAQMINLDLSESQLQVGRILVTLLGDDSD
jgi:2C-methyl-D-erythritol 2,4-cyclodiphosphate synthase